MADQNQPANASPPPAAPSSTPPAPPKVEAPVPELDDTPRQAPIVEKLIDLKDWYKSHLKLSLPITFLLLILIIAAVPFLRYNTVGLVLKKNYTVQVIDLATKTPVSGAQVSIGAINATTDGSGKAVLRTKVGPHKLDISKKYYSSGQATVTVPILSEKKIPAIPLKANGRQVKISVTNIINHKSIAKVDIKVADITAQTDSDGTAIIVLPPGVPKQGISLSANGYNDSSTTISVSDTEVAENKLTLTPTGKVYFLSKRTGKIDVMKSNLDGSDQKVVLAGTGTESDPDTILLASRDWKYLVLKSKRDNNPAKLYYIDTSVDKLNTLDEGNADFLLIGWSGNTFVYQVNRNGMSVWQPNQQALKSFDATTGKLTLLDQTQGVGTGFDLYAHEYYGNNYLLDNTLVYTKTWVHNYSTPHGAVGKKSGIYSVSVDGSNAKTLQSIDFPINTANARIDFSSALYKPKEIYFQVEYFDTTSSISYFKYKGGVVNQDNSLAPTYYKLASEPNPAFLLSPSSKQTFWAEPRDGKSVLFVGDQNGDNAKDVATLDSKYLNYGYYSDDYLLVSKDNDEIYIMPVDGVKSAADLIKITDYHKPVYDFFNFGGGYGGL